jgi:hypothetical protein
MFTLWKVFDSKKWAKAVMCLVVVDGLVVYQLTSTLELSVVGVWVLRD